MTDEATRIYDAARRLGILEQGRGLETADVVAVATKSGAHGARLPA
jgi:hypothetical protein